MSTLLITGAGGLLGKAAVEAAVAHGHAVTALYHSPPAHTPGARIVTADLKDHAAIAALIETTRAGWIIHAAAHASPDFCEDHPDEAWAVNADATRNIAQAAARAGSRVLYVSTDSVFDGARGNYSETDATNPISVYARAKLAGEQAVLAASPGNLSVRTTLIGWGAKKPNLAELVFRRLGQGSAMTGYADVIFTPLPVWTLSEIMLCAIGRSLAGIWHVASADACSKYEFCRRLARQFGFDPGLVRPVSVDSAGLRAPRPKNASLNTAKITAALGRPMPAIDEGIAEFAARRP
ncbi:MAG TPA: SDR family oxidoreductase [Terriglobales bacterium]|nr:SDR family oxidoreductase [Terriglobales bacterium]